MENKPFTLALATESPDGEVKRHDVEVTQADLSAELTRGVRDWRAYAAVLPNERKTCRST